MEALIIPALLAVYAVAFMVRAWTPVRYAAERGDLTDLGDGIVVQKRGETQTGWALVGDQDALVKGFWEPVRLSGDIPPQGTLAAGTLFYCVAEYIGSWTPEISETEASGNEPAEYDEFHVYEWFVLAPVRRVSTLPARWFPDGFLSLYDQNPIWPFGKKLWKENPPDEEDEEGRTGAK